MTLRREMHGRPLRKPKKALIRLLAENIRRLRQLRHLSQEELADVSGFHRTYVGSVERGERNVTLSTLEAFATAFGISVPELLTPIRTKADGDPRPS